MLKFQNKMRNAKEKITKNDRLIKKMIIANLAVAVIGFHCAVTGLNIAADCKQEQEYLKHLKSTDPALAQTTQATIESSYDIMMGSLSAGTICGATSIAGLCASVPLIKQFDKNQSKTKNKRRDFDVTKSFDA